MNTFLRGVLGAAVLSTALVSIASAQSALGRTSIAQDRNEDLRDDITDDAERDIRRFGNEGRPEGFAGSVALRGIAESGNTENATLGVGADMTYVQGPNGFEMQLNYTYGEDDQGFKDEESLYYSFEYDRDFTPTLFGFVKIQGASDKFSSFESDTFASLGLGYRIFNEPNRQWSVQAGPGYRFADLSDVTDGNIDEVGIGFSSDYAQKLTDTVFLTNDTDIITSDSDTVVFNDLAINVSMSDSLALRTSLLTEYHTDPAPGFNDTDNTFGVSLVYSFN